MFSPVCVLLVQLASTNVFYSMRKLKGILFMKVYRYLEVLFNPFLFNLGGEGKLVLAGFLLVFR